MQALEPARLHNTTTLGELQQLLDEHELTIRCASLGGSRQIAVSRGSAQGAVCISAPMSRPLHDQLSAAVDLFLRGQSPR